MPVAPRLASETWETTNSPSPHRDRKTYRSPSIPISPNFHLSTHGSPRSN